MPVLRTTRMRYSHRLFLCILIFAYIPPVAEATLLDCQGIVETARGRIDLDDAEIDRRISWLKSKDDVLYEHARKLTEVKSQMGESELAYLWQVGGFRELSRMETERFYGNELAKVRTYVLNEIAILHATKTFRSIQKDPRLQAGFSKLEALINELGLNFPKPENLSWHLVLTASRYQKSSDSLDIDQILAALEHNILRLAEDQMYRQYQELNTFLYESGKPEDERDSAFLARVGISLEQPAEKVRALKQRLKFLESETRESQRVFAVARNLDLFKRDPHCCHGGCAACPINFGIYSFAKARGQLLPSADRKQAKAVQPPELLVTYQIVNELEREMPGFKWR